MSFGENLIKLRRQKGWSQDDLANNLDLSRQAISKWENNTSKPDIDNLKKISNIFSIKIDELVNNEIPDNKAVTLDVKKEEKKEKTITIVKLIIIAVIILYVISVIYKFCSLLIIVNGVQKYANLNNYHYVITTYDENGLVEKEECWFKDGVSKTENTKFNKGSVQEQNVTYLNYIEKKGYLENVIKNTKQDVDYETYIKFHNEYEKGGQLFANLPASLKKGNTKNFICEVLGTEILNIKKEDGKIFLNLSDGDLTLSDKTLLPISMFLITNDNHYYFYYSIEINTLEKL